MGVDDCRRLYLPEVVDDRGKLCVIEGDSIPFTPARTFFIYDIPPLAVRGGHAHFQCEQLIVAVHGKFEVTLKDGTGSRRYGLDNPAEGLYVRPLIWCSLEKFSKGAVCLVLASMPYRQDDYCRNYEDFLNIRGAK